MKDGSKIKSKLDVADAHPNGNKPFKREDYIHKFKTLTSNLIDQKESERFLSNAQSLRELDKSDLYKLNIEVKSDLKKHSTYKKTIF
jgi:2-methylcitrate dehydratase